MSQEYLPLTTGSFSTQDGLAMCILTERYKDMCILLKSKMALEEGSDIGTLPVVVMWDGLEYETTAHYKYSADFGTATYIIGNGSIIDGNPKQGEPFCFLSGAEYSWCLIVGTTQGGDSHTFSISEKSEDSGDAIPTGKAFLLHRMFSKPYANAMTGKWFWFGKSRG